MTDIQAVLTKTTFTKLAALAGAVALLSLTAGQAFANSHTQALKLEEERKRRNSTIAISSQVCPPAGYVRGDMESIKDGEFQYCVKRAPGDRLLKRSACLQVAPAEEYIRVESGRKDAIYSGMGLHANSEILFYCLPKSTK